MTRDSRTPQQAYDATIKATPRTAPLGAHFRVRADIVDHNGKVSLRRAGRLHHLGIGRHHAGQAVLILVDHAIATVTNQTTGEILSHHHVEPDKNYWRNQDKEPGRWPSSS